MQQPLNVDRFIFTSEESQTLFLLQCRQNSRLLPICLVRSDSVGQLTTNEAKDVTGISQVMTGQYSAINHFEDLGNRYSKLLSDVLWCQHVQWTLDCVSSCHVVTSCSGKLR